MKKLIMHKLLTTVFLLFVVSMFFCTTASAVQIFFDDFNSGVAKAEFSGSANSVVGVQGYAGLGTGANTFADSFLRNADAGNPVAASTYLKLTGLPTHTSIDLNFLLAIIDSWDGNSGNVINAPDTFNVKIDGDSVFSETFDNWGKLDQGYIAPSGVALIARPGPYVDIGFNGAFPDGAYDMGLDPIFDSIAHTSSILTVEWFAGGTGWQGDWDESWAIDNVEVVLNGVVVPEPILNPEPTTIALLGIGLVGLAGAEVRRRRKKKVVGKS